MKVCALDLVWLANCVLLLQRDLSQSVHFGLALTKFKSTEHMRMEPVCYLHQHILGMCTRPSFQRRAFGNTSTKQYAALCMLWQHLQLTTFNILGRKLESLYLLPLYKFPSLSTVVCDFTPVFLSNHVQPLLHPINFLYALEYN